MMKQSKLDSFFQTPKLNKLPLTQTKSVKETLEPLFIRQIPQEKKYIEQLDLEYELI